MYFRPLPRFTALFVPMFLMLIALGVWQLERLQWKLGLIAEMNAHLHAPAISLDRVLALPRGQAQYQPVALQGEFDNSKEAFVYASSDDGTAIYHLLVPFAVGDGRSVIVDRGVLPLQLKNPATRRAGIQSGERRVAGIWRVADAPGVFTPPPDLKNHVWYSRDVRGIARFYGLTLAAPALVEADATPVPGGWPKGGQTVVTLPNDHLQYALTWFLMAAGLVIIYFAYHRAQGRFGFRR